MGVDWRLSDQAVFFLILLWMIVVSVQKLLNGHLIGNLQDKRLIEGD